MNGLAIGNGLPKWNLTLAKWLLMQSTIKKDLQKSKLYRELLFFGGQLKRCDMATRLPTGPFVIYVKLETREDGGLRAHCDEVPGFILSHSNADKVLADVVPSLECILTAMFGCKMKVERARELGQRDDVQMPAHLCGPLQYVGHSRTH